MVHGGVLSLYFLHLFGLWLHCAEEAVDRTPLIEVVGGVPLVALLVLHADLLHGVGNLGALPDYVGVVPQYGRFIRKVLALLVRTQLVALGTVSALPEVDGVLQLGKVHGAIETVHRDAIVLVILVIVVLLLRLFLLLPSLGVRAISSGLIGPVAKTGQLLVDFAHVAHVLLETFLLVLVDVPRLHLADVILVLLDVGLRLHRGLVVPEELLHVVAVGLHGKVLEERDQHAHEGPDGRCVHGVDHLLRPQVEHDQDRVKHHAQALGGDHRHFLDPQGHERPDEIVEAV